MNFCRTLFRCVFSITKMTSAHSIRSPLTGVSASLFVPQPIALKPSYAEKTSSPVGLRNLFSLQTKSKFIAFLLHVTPQATARFFNHPADTGRACTALLCAFFSIFRPSCGTKNHSEKSKIFKNSKEKRFGISKYEMDISSARFIQRYL